MNNYTEHTWTLVTFNQAVHELMKTYMDHPPRKLRSEGYSGPITLTMYQRFHCARDKLKEGGFSPPMPTGTKIAIPVNRAIVDPVVDRVASQARL